MISIITLDFEAAWKPGQILIRWLDQKPVGLDLHCFLKRIHMGTAGQGLTLVVSYFICILFVTVSQFEPYHMTASLGVTMS